mmetsp:Transcript_11861/g.27367  ORF Transcript_11861/g.27367 Transcript_11861/m.27367 type:complete len:102 (-) Transcript_11861:868-1173(-)
MVKDGNGLLVASSGPIRDHFLRVTGLTCLRVTLSHLVLASCFIDLEEVEQNPHSFEACCPGLHSLHYTLYQSAPLILRVMVQHEVNDTMIHRKHFAFPTSP